MDPEIRSLADYWRIVSRRRWQLLVPAAVVLLAAVLLALLLPPVYRSSATILIEEPDVPPELVTSTITGFADQRLQVINQRVMATQNLADIINRYDLYTDARRRLPIARVVEDMRDDITMDLVSADVRDPRSGRPSEATIAFTVAFDYGDPVTVQRVTNELVSLYLSENLRERQQKASETAAFLSGEADQLERQIADYERQLAELKRSKAGSLPEQLQYNLQLIERAEREVLELDRLAQSLEERRIFLEAQLLQISPYGSVSVDGRAVAGPADQLKALQTELITLSGRYGPDHPDVVKVRREVAALEAVAGTAPGGGVLRGELSRVSTELEKAQERYGPDHPDVVALTRQKRELETALAEAGRRPPTRLAAGPADNPAYIQLNAQVQAAKAEIAAINTQRAALKQRIADTEARIGNTPSVEREFAAIVRDYESARQEFQEIKRKQMAAEMGQALEAERKSERFSLIEPPVLPTEPHRPNRLAIFLLGFVLSVGAGLGTGVLAESTDTSVRSTRQIARLTGHPPLVAIPVIRTRRDVRRQWTVRAAIVGVGLAFIIAALAYVHGFVVPLDVAWASFERRLGLASPSSTP